MAASTPSKKVDPSLSALLADHPVLGSLAMMVITFLTLLASFRFVTDLLDRFDIPSNPDQRNSFEFWISGIVAFSVILAVGFVLHSFWWPAIASAPLFLFSITTRGAYDSSLEEAFFGWMPRFFLTSALITAVAGAGGTLLARWANASRPTDATRWASRVAVGLMVFIVTSVVLAGATNALIDETGSPSQRSVQERCGQWIYGVASNQEMLVLGTGDGIVAFDPATQTELWHVITGEPAMLAPKVTADRIYFGSHTTYVYALDLNGTELWRYDMENWLFRTPVVSDGMVFVGSSAKFVALDAGTGQEVWIIDLGTWVEISWSEVVDGMIYLGTAHGELIAVEAKTGVEQWRFVVPPPPDATPESGNRNPWIRNGAAVADGLVYFGNGEGHFYALDAATGEVRWEFDTGRTGYPNVVVMDGVAYMVTHGNVYALDAVSGSIIWHVEVDGGIWYRPVVTGDLLNVAYDRVRGKLIGIDRDTGETRWTFAYSDDPELTYEFPEMHVRGGTLYTGSTGQGLFALDAASGAFLWRVEKP